MVDDQKSAEIVLAGENAATGGLEAHDVQGNRMEMARKKPRGKGRLCMIFRLGKRPHCEFTNGFPPKDSITREKPAL
ncbi:uncharacterized protein LOC26526674 [Drosophila erecta]|uniref:Uncharacterized protein n=1 Tax=Drosophila erecta TaxID=7220 RepID=A0A0Q5TIG9_DROER|nr:uncharacterized protein LOC26526674 [Drosophila erecta]KQS29766.1 uncharacterized protein Dere_GG26850 [Drosophila erecta]